MGKVEVIRFKSGREYRVIDGEYVIGAGGACKERSCLKGKVINGEYWVDMCEEKKCNDDFNKLNEFRLGKYIEKIDKLPDGLEYFEFATDNTCVGGYYLDENGNVKHKNGAIAGVKPPICLFKYGLFTGTNDGCDTPINDNRTLYLIHCFELNYCEGLFYRLEDGNVFEVYYDKDYFYLTKGLVLVINGYKRALLKCFDVLKIKRLCKGL